MEILAAVQLLTTLIGTASSFMTQAQAISDIIAKAQAEGRTKLTEDEWASIIGADDAARKALQDAIAAA